MSEDLENEIWKDVEGYEDLYQVSNMGRFKRDHILKTVLQPTGYLNVCLCKNGKCKTYRAHKLVAKAFIPNPNNYQVINHKNGNKQDNRVENLEWCTTSYNSWHSVFVLNKGHNKLSMKDANKIRKDVLAGKYNNIKEIAQEYKCNRLTIESILSNISYKTNNSYPIEVLRRKNVLSKEIITKIRSEYSNGERSVSQLAKKFGLKTGLIANIVTNKSYKDAEYKYVPYETYRINNIYGTLKLLKKERVNKHTYYTCECIKCGHIHKYYDNIKLQERDCDFCKEKPLRKNNKSGYSSLYYRKQRKKWEVLVTINYKRYHLGVYDTQKEALTMFNEFMQANQLDSRIQEYHGELVIMNDEQRKAQEEWEKQNKNNF